MDLKKLKVGTPIIVTNSRNGAPLKVLLTIVSVYIGYYYVKDEQGRQFSVYFGGNPNDEFILGDRKSRIEATQKRVDELKEEYTNTEKELEILSEYESDEDYAADKISKIISMGGNRKEIAKILKELKETHYL